MIHLDYASTKFFKINKREQNNISIQPRDIAIRKFNFMWDLHVHIKKNVKSDDERKERKMRGKSYKFKREMTLRTS